MKSIVLPFLLTLIYINFTTVSDSPQQKNSQNKPSFPVLDLGLLGKTSGMNTLAEKAVLIQGDTFISQYFKDQDLNVFVGSDIADQVGYINPDGTNISANDFFNYIRDLGYNVSGPSVNTYSLSTFERASSVSQSGGLISLFTKEWSDLGHADVVRSVNYYLSGKSPRVNLRVGSRTLSWLQRHQTSFGIIKP